MKNQYIRYKLDPQKPWTLTLYLSGGVNFTVFRFPERYRVNVHGFWGSSL